MVKTKLDHYIATAESIERTAKGAKKTVDLMTALGELGDMLELGDDDEGDDESEEYSEESDDESE